MLKGDYMAAIAKEFIVNPVKDSKLTIKVKVSKIFCFRIWLGSKIMKIGSLVAGFDVIDVDIRPGA